RFNQNQLAGKSGAPDGPPSRLFFLAGGLLGWRTERRRHTPSFEEAISLIFLRLQPRAMENEKSFLSTNCKNARSLKRRLRALCTTGSCQSKSIDGRTVPASVAFGTAD